MGLFDTGRSPANWPQGMLEALTRRPSADASRPTPPEVNRRRDDADAERRQKMLVPHQDTFASIFNAGLRVFYSRFDEALKDSWQDALAMRRDAFIIDLLRHRQLPTVSLPWHIEVDDPKDPEQAAVAARYTKLIESIHRFQAMRLYLAEDLFYGKYGSQVVYDRVMIDGRPGVTVARHEPVNGDKIRYKFDGTPGILVHSGWAAKDPVVRTRVEPTDWGQAVFLYDSFWRDRFIISEFEPSDTDWMFEADLAGGIHGVGYRSRLWFVYKLRMHFLEWMADALQRIGVNGMLFGFFEDGNPESQDAIIRALQMLIRDNVTAFPRKPGDKTEDVIQRIEPTEVGYDILFKLINDYLDEIMRRCVLGQTLSGQAQATGLGSKVAELHESTFENYVRFDAVRHGETFTKDLLGPLRKMNPIMYRGKVYRGEDIPFRLRMKLSVDQADVQQKVEVIKTAYDIGLPIDSEQVYEALGLSPPKDGANILKKPDPGMGMDGADGQPGNAPPGQSPAQAQGSGNSNGQRFKIVRGSDGKIHVKFAQGQKPQMVSKPEMSAA